jgi:endonuclease YncB( thermonuclease family)
MTDPRYHYRCRLLQAIDGDTVLLEVELGFHLTYEVTTRLAGINAPERRSGSQAEREAGEKAANFVENWCWGRVLILKTTKDQGDKFGRILATLIDQDTGKTVQEALIAAGLAVAYDGKTARKPWTGETR